MNNVIQFPNPPSDMDTLVEILKQYTVQELICIIKDKDDDQVTFIVPPLMSIHEVAGRCTDVSMAVLLGMADD